METTEQHWDKVLDGLKMLGCLETHLTHAIHATACRNVVCHQCNDLVEIKQGFWAHQSVHAAVVQFSL